MRPAGGSSGAAASSRDGALGETRLPIEQERISAKAFVPPWVRFAHVARYDFAAAFVREKRVVDGACGSGYGSAMLASAGARSVLGLDIADDGLREATETYDAPNLSFRKCDLSTLDVPASSCDVFISFETIEHVPDDGAFLSGNRRALAPDGVFLCSTPNRPITNPGTSIVDRPYNRFSSARVRPSRVSGTSARAFRRGRHPRTNVLGAWVRERTAGAVVGSPTRRGALASNTKSRYLPPRPVRELSAAADRRRRRTGSTTRYQPAVSRTLCRRRPRPSVGAFG